MCAASDRSHQEMSNSSATLRRSLFLLFLAGLWGAALSNGCVRELSEDVDFPGDDILQIFSPDVSHCQLACTQHHSCQFFTFIRPDWTLDSRQFYCYLKYTIAGKPSNITPLKGVTSGYSLKDCSGSPSDACLSTVYRDVDFFGADYTSLFTDSYAQCQAACTQDPGCQFFTFSTNHYHLAMLRNKCHLKYSRTLPTPPAVKFTKGVVSGFSRRHCSLHSLNSECQSMIVKDTNFPGNDFERVPAPSPEHCRLLCTSHPQCTFFSYTTINYDEKLMCYLKHNTNERPVEAKANVMSGNPARFCKPSQKCEPQMYENVDFPGMDRKSVVLNTPEECKEACAADPSCQFYTFAGNTFFLPSLRRKCFLKQVITVPLPPDIMKKQGLVSGFHLRSCKQTSTETTADAVTDAVIDAQCGVTQERKEKVVGGTNATPNAWLWQVSLQVKSKFGNTSHYCGGSIISPGWVVTAAHCVQSSNPSHYVIATGILKLSLAAELHEVEKIIVHPGFEDATFENDIALFKLKTPLKYTVAQRSICLLDKQREDSFWGKTCWITGWGKLSSGALPDVLQQAQVPLIKPEACASLLPDNTIFNTMLCAGFPAGGIDTCQGDSGGPLVCQDDSKWYLMGITSWGDGCGEAGKPGVYTHVTRYTEWIQSSISH